ncbi:MAG: hypothetical protein LBH44_04800 [Treponema sp.]|jgi:hypothetical protein|nr:hypothetical protein [Treponema sp.]
MNIRKTVFLKYFIIFFPILIVNAIGGYFYFEAQFAYSTSLSHEDYWATIRIAGIFGMYNYFINPVYQLIINVIYNIKEEIKNYSKNFVLMVFSFFLE